MFNNEWTYAQVLQAYQNKFSQAYPFTETSNLNLYDWIKIKIKSERTLPAILPFFIAITEIFRFEIGITQPECRLSDTYFLSKKIEQEAEVGQFRVRTLYYYWKKFCDNQPLFWEGMGRVIFCRYLYQDNDFNLYNAIVDKNNYFIGLDIETCFWSILEKYHYGPQFKPSNVKIVSYDNVPFPAEKVMTSLGMPIYVIKEKTRDFIGDLHVEDYDNLPQLKYSFPSQWFFHQSEIKDYTHALSNNARFLNEKYFSTLKSLVTINIKKLLIELHITHEKDKQDAMFFLVSQIEKLKQLSLQSNGFITYLREHYFTAIKAVIYELNQFFNFSSAYQLENLNRVFQFFYQDILCQFSSLLEKFNVPLTSHEKQTLLCAAEKIISQEEEECKNIKNFYQTQSMDYHSNQII